MTGTEKIGSHSYKIDFTITSSDWVTSGSYKQYTYSYAGIQTGDEFYFSPKDSTVSAITVDMTVVPGTNNLVVTWLSSTAPTVNITISGRVWHF